MYYCNTNANTSVNAKIINRKISIFLHLYLQFVSHTNITVASAYYASKQCDLCHLGKSFQIWRQAWLFLCLHFSLCEHRLWLDSCQLQNCYDLPHLLQFCSELLLHVDQCVHFLSVDCLIVCNYLAHLVVICGDQCVQCVDLQCQLSDFVVEVAVINKHNLCQAKRSFHS